MSRVIPIGIEQIVREIKNLDYKCRRIRQDADRETNLRKTKCKGCGCDIPQREGECWVRFYPPDGWIYSEFCLCKRCNEKVLERCPEAREDYG